MTRRARERDERFAAFFDAESEKLRRLAIFLTGDPDEAADLAQEALARTYRRWWRVREEDPGPYARRILVNLVRSRHRRSLVERRHHQTSRDLVPSETWKVDEWLHVADALGTLTPIRRTVVVLRFYEDMSLEDIARTLDRPLGTVKSDVHRALAQLRRLLQDTERQRA